MESSQCNRPTFTSACRSSLVARRRSITSSNVYADARALGPAGELASWSAGQKRYHSWFRRSLADARLPVGQQAISGVYPSPPELSSPARLHVLTADKVLVTVGTPCSVSAVGSTETYLAKVAGSPDFIGFAAFDAGLVDIDPQTDGSVRFRWTTGEPATIEEIEQRHGSQLRSNSGIRYIEELTRLSGSVVTEIAASLPHDLDRGGLRRLAGLSYRDVRESALKDMYGLFDDDPRLGPSLQAQLFIYGGVGALAALPAALSELLPNPYDFRIAAATAFAGLDALHEWRGAGNVPVDNDKLRDKFAMRLANS